MSAPGTYASEQKAVRRALLAVYDPADPCARCGWPLGPDPARIDLGHVDDRSGYSGLEHARCNRRAGARLGNARRRARRERTVRMVAEVALALEISEDRQHCSTVAAGRLEGGLVLLELVAYLDSTDPVPAVLELRTQRTVLVAVVDPHSHAATCIRPLEAAGVEVTKPASQDLVEAHGLFLDALAAGRVRHQGQAQLTAAMRPRPAGRSRSKGRSESENASSPGQTGPGLLCPLRATRRPGPWPPGRYGGPGEPRRCRCAGRAAAPPARPAHRRRNSRRPTR